MWSCGGILKDLSEKLKPFLAANHKKQHRCSGRNNSNWYSPEQFSLMVLAFVAGVLLMKMLWPLF
jgi:hypothetical protein